MHSKVGTVQGSFHMLPRKSVGPGQPSHFIGESIKKELQRVERAQSLCGAAEATEDIVSTPGREVSL